MGLKAHATVSTLILNLWINKLEWLLQKCLFSLNDPYNTYPRFIICLYTDFYNLLFLLLSLELGFNLRFALTKRVLYCLSYTFNPFSLVILEMEPGLELWSLWSQSPSVLPRIKDINLQCPNKFPLYNLFFLSDLPMIGFTII
jgi:hypothetical protein